MKRFAKIVIALILVLSTLSGCSAYMEGLPDRVYTYEDLTITIPGRFGDESDASWAEKLAFYYCYGNYAVLATKKTREEVEETHPGMTALEYAQDFAKSVEITEPVEEKDGLITFCYTMKNDAGIAFSYLCAAYKSTGYYWLLQCISPSDIYEESRESLLTILRSVTVQ